MTRTRRTVYDICGMRLRSEVELHVPVAAGPDWDVDVRMGVPLDAGREPQAGEVVAVDEAHGIGWYCVTATATDHRLRFRECAEFVISGDTSTVTVRPQQGGRTELVPILLAGTVSALVLTLRGTTVLHASAVALDDFALALVGQSGRGKSTLAALLCAAGAELVTDDVLAVEPGNPFRCVGGATELRLRGGSTPIVDDLPGAPSRPTADHRVALAPMAHRAGAIELGAIVFPFPSRTRSSVEVRLIPPGEALVGLLACPRINGWRRDAEIGRDFAVLAAVADAVPAFTAVVPWGPPFASEVATEVARAVRARR